MHLPTRFVFGYVSKMVLVLMNGKNGKCSLEAKIAVLNLTVGFVLSSVLYLT